MPFRVQTLAYLSEQGQVSQLFELTFDKLWSHEAQDCQRELDELQLELSVFEEQYGYSSAEFYQRFQNGKTDDRMDFIEWASFCQMAVTQVPQVTVTYSRALVAVTWGT